MPATDAAFRAAKRLRRDLTLPEVKLWQILRKKPQGLKFRRQHPVGDYVLDFYCAQAKCGFEIDGIAHNMGNRPARDEARDVAIRAMGIEVVRIPATDVLRSAENVAENIVRFCQES